MCSVIFLPALDAVLGALVIALDEWRVGHRTARRVLKAPARHRTRTQSWVTSVLKVLICICATTTKISARSRLPQAYRKRFNTCLHAFLLINATQVPVPAILIRTSDATTYIQGGAENLPADLLTLRPAILLAPGWDWIGWLLQGKSGFAVRPDPI